MGGLFLLFSVAIVSGSETRLSGMRHARSSLVINVTIAVGITVPTRTESLRPLSPLARRRIIVASADGDGDGRRAGHLQLRLLQARAEGGVLDAQLVDEVPALLPAAVRLVRGGQRCVEKLRAGFELLDVSVAVVSVCLSELQDTH